MVSPMFKLSILKKKKELIPLVALVSMACGGALCFSMYSLFWKSDVYMKPSHRQHPRWELDPERRQKILKYNPDTNKYVKNEEIEALRKEISQ